MNWEFFLSSDQGHGAFKVFSNGEHINVETDNINSLFCTKTADKQSDEKYTACRAYFFCCCFAFSAFSLRSFFPSENEFEHSKFAVALLLPFVSVDHKGPKVFPESPRQNLARIVNKTTNSVFSSRYPAARQTITPTS